MKRNTFLHKTTLTVLAFLALAACQGRAATVPLSAPKGLALDAKGNLYVANLGAAGSNGSVTMYNASYVQKKVFFAGLTNPTGVAFDSRGNMYVSNLGSFTVTLYDSKGNLLSNTITDGIQSPEGIAVDSLDDIWVNNAFTDITMYSPYLNKIASSTPGTNIDSFAVHGPWYVFGVDAGALALPAGEVLTNGGTAGESIYPSIDPIQGVAFDAKGDYYVCHASGEVDFLASGASAVQLIVLGYAPSGVVVDSTRSRIYFASDSLNKIDVYSTAKGILTYITTIH